jgi:hypothetical protein
MRRADNRRGTYSRACASLALETAERWIDWVVDDVDSVAEEDFFMGPDPFTKERPLFLNAAAVDLRQYGPKCPPPGSPSAADAASEKTARPRKSGSMSFSGCRRTASSYPKLRDL